MVRIYRALMNGLMSLTALSVLCGILLAINPDLRREVARRVSTGRAINSVSETRGVARGMVRTARSQTIGYASLLLFVGAALVLVVFMLRV